MYSVRLLLQMKADGKRYLLWSIYHDPLGRGAYGRMPETTPLIKVALNLKEGACFDVYDETVEQSI